MIQIGILLAILGFGSLLLQEFGYEFRLLSWAEDMQPGFGIVLGIVGLALAGVGVWMNQKKKEPTVQEYGGFNNGQQTPGQPAQPAYGAPQGGPQTGGQSQQGPAFGQPGQPGQYGQPAPQGQPPHGDGPIQGPGFGERR